MNAIERKSWWREAERLLGLYRELLTEFECLQASLDDDDVAELQFLEVLIRAEHTRSGPLAS